MADGEVKIETKLDTSGLEKGLKNVKNKVNNSANDIGKGTKSTNALKTAFNEAGGAASSFASKMGSVASGGGAVAAGISAAVLAAKKYIETLKEANEAYKVQEKAENALQKAAENNPYLNGESVRRLKEYASTIQSASNFGDEGTIDVMAQLAASGRSESEIMKLVAAAADYAAAKHISLESAVQNLNKSYGGLAGELGELFPEVKALTAEQLKNGEAVDVIASKYKGFAAEAADSSTQAKNSFGDFMESIGKIAHPAFEALNARAKSFWETMTTQMNKFSDALETASRKWAIGGTKRSVDEGVNLINTEFKDTQTGKMRGAEEVQTKEYLEWLNQELEIRNKINGTLTSEEMQALLLIKSEIRKRNEIEKTAKAEETAVKTKEAQKTADDYAKKSNKSLQESLHALEVEAKAKGESVSAQDKYNVYLQSYIDLLTKTEGLIKEGYPVEQKRLDQLQEAKKAVEEAADAEEKLAAAIELTQAATDALNSANRHLTPAEELDAEIKQLDDIKSKIEAMSAAEIAAAQKGQEAQLSKAQLIAGLNEAERQATLAKVDAITPTEQSGGDKYASQQKEMLELKKSIDESEVLSEQEKIDALKAIDEAYSQSRKQQFAELAAEINGYVQQTADIAKEAGDLMLKNVQTETDLELAELDKKYEAGEMSEEQYYEKKKQIQQKAAREEYKIKMFQWTASMLAATANIAEGVSKAMVLGFPQGLIAGALVGAAGGVQLASIIASKPVPPQFYAGGIIGGANGATYGSDNTYIHARNGEMVLNAHQQRSLWDMINGQDSRKQAGLNLTVNNSQSNKVDTQFREEDGAVILDIVDKRVNKGFVDGTFDGGYSSMLSRQEGVKIL